MGRAKKGIIWEVGDIFHQYDGISRAKKNEFSQNLRKLKTNLFYRIFVDSSGTGKLLKKNILEQIDPAIPLDS